MIDILVRLYDLEPIGDVMKRVNDNGIIIRRPIGPEKEAIVEWITENFSSKWASESETAFLIPQRLCTLLSVRVRCPKW